MLEWNWIPVLMTGFGTMFLIGEILVKARGLFGLLGLAFTWFYFFSYVNADTIWLMIGLYFLGMILIVIDGKLLNDGTLSAIGLVIMLLSVGFSAPNWAAGIYAVIGVLAGAAGSLLFLKAFKKRDMWQKIALIDTLSSEKGYNSMNESYHSLVGQTGVAITPMRPTGTIRINDKDYSAVSGGRWVEKDTPIKVVSVDGTRILIETTAN